MSEMKRDELISAGIDYDEGVHRFAGNERVYEKYLLKFFQLDPMVGLQTAIVSGDYEGAFRLAHNLKSSCGNMSISILYKTVCELVEALRGGAVDDSALKVLCERASEQYSAAKLAVMEDA